MLSWIVENIGSIIVGAIVIIIIAFIIYTKIKNRKAGKTSCGCGCSNCPIKDKCH